MSIRKALLSFMTAITIVTGQSINAISSVLSVCNYPASISPMNLSSVLTQTRGMIKNCSYNHASFKTYVVPNVIHVPCDYTPGQITKDTPCPFYHWAKYADEQVRLRSKKTNARFKYHIYVLPNIPSCRFGGMGTLAPCKPNCRVWVMGSVATQLHVYFHELGHNLGLHHAMYKKDEYGDISDAMGYCCLNRCFSAPHSDALNWTKPIIHTNMNTLLPNEYIRLHDTYGPMFVQFRKREHFAPIKETVPFFFNCVNIYRSQHTSQGVWSMLSHVLCDKNSKWISRDNSTIVQLLEINDKQAKVQVLHSLLKW